MGEQAQFDLGIIGRQQNLARIGDERLADLAAFLGAHRDVLQVRVGGREASGLSDRHGKAGMDAARGRVDGRLQRFGIGRAELGQGAPVDDGAG